MNSLCTLGLERARSPCDPGGEDVDCLAGASIGFLSQNHTSEFSEGEIPVQMGSAFPEKSHTTEWRHPISGTVILDKPFPPRVSFPGGGL